VSAIDEADQILRSRPVADVGHLLKPGGLAEVEREIARLAVNGLFAHVVLTPAGETLGPWHALWTRQGYDAHRDLLLLFNGRRWEARGWELSPAAIDAALAAAEPALRQYYGRGLVVALGNLGRATGRDKKEREDEGRKSSSLLGVLAGAGAVTAAAAIGWVVIRRRRLARERRQALHEARSSADQVFADVLLAAEDMTGPDAAQLRDKATRLRDQIEALAPPNLKQLPAKEESLTLARLRQMENELEALRSSVLQAKRRP
jgi:hypothetical protein